MSSYEVRRFEDADWPAVLDLMRLSLGWRDGDPNEALFSWKHRDNPFGPSPAWVAVERDQVIGFRTFMRWEFEDSGRVVRAVRAVDTATHPDHQGRGIFKRLTLHAVDELRDEGVDFVFNTPNDQSRPGYLKMGWQVVGRLPVVFRPRSLARLPVLARSRGAADLWSVPSQVGVSAPAAFAGLDPRVLGSRRRTDAGLSTRRSTAYLHWRYGLPELQYRVLTAGQAPEDGLVVVRVRKRVAARELVVCEVLARDARRGRATVVRAISRSSADYAVALRPTAGLVPLPGQGPLLTCLPLQGQGVPALDRWKLTLGDVELF